MKRYVCTVAAGMLLALAGTATASAGELPIPGQTATQETIFGDQAVGEQRNDADVTQKQGNGNVSIAPAIAVFGDAETTNEQGNHNEASVDVDQKNSVEQTQASEQDQAVSGEAGPKGCCDGQSQTGEQTTYGGDQTVEKQKNDADVTQKQGNGNVSVAPAIAVFGDAETTNKEGNGSSADAEVDQRNDVDQSQRSSQKQSVSGEAERPCCGSKKGDHGYGKSKGCCDGQSQTGQQTTSFGDQYVGEQRNDADVSQWQGNGNVAIAPAIAVFGDAKTTNYQGNGNEANADVDQKNSVDQEQSSSQGQTVRGEAGHCCGGQSQTGKQRMYFGDQTVGEQRNDADVSQWQGNGNVWIGPAIAIGGDAETRNYQGNGNTANADVDQRNDVDQSQSSKRKQSVSGEAGRCCDSKKGYGGRGCCDGSSQAGEQKTSFGDQYVGEQRDDADVTQAQGNGNSAFAPAVAIGGKKHGSCSSKCGESRHGGAAAETTNSQGNGNRAHADVDQKNSVDQTQSSTQEQSLVRPGCCRPAKTHGKKDWRRGECCGHGQTGSQKTFFGDQTVGEQRSDADVMQKQGNGNVSIAPAIAIGGKKHDSCSSKCGKSEHRGTTAETTNAQGNGNEAHAQVDQTNDVDQVQLSSPSQTLVEERERVLAH